jgi:hypothetical protein
MARDYDDTEESPSEIEQVGLTLAVGVGYGRPLWDAYQAAQGTTIVTSLDNIIAGQIPVVFSLGLRPSPYLSFGAVLQYAPLVTRNCDVGSTCSASNTYVGMELRLHVLPDRVVCPWLSFGLGYEWLSLSETGTRNVDGGFQGRDYDIELGTDIRVTRSVALGPYIGLRFGKYGTMSGSNYSSSGDTIPDQAQKTHGWWVLGMRGTFTVSKS